MDITLSLVLPCFNEEANVQQTIRESLAWFDAEKIRGEVIAVNDGSRDRTGELLEEFANSDSRLKIVTHETNLGYGVAIRSGCDAATAVATARGAVAVLSVARCAEPTRNRWENSEQTQALLQMRWRSL